ncbi:MAG TPA: tetratricopeptide repeat protein [Nannocystaceae bacterium]|nr:tetratricopeptide repeat protein [Nannocystaceae bacterium]
MECLSEDGIAAFAEGRIDEDERELIERHLDACSDCARLVVEFARVFSDRSPDESMPWGDRTTRAAPDLSMTAGEEAAILRAGTCVGRYRVLECVGRGGMGVVYGAYDPELDRRVALKLLRGRAARDGQRNARLQREAQAMARLSHPNVITVHDVGTHVPDESGHPVVYVAMEFVEGTTLGRWARAKPRSWAELRSVCIAAGRGLEAAHAAGLVHRDFKPDNVLVGDDGRVRVTDFGLARFADTTLSDEDIGPSTRIAAVTLATRTGAMLGTPAYMAPEQYGGGRVGPASDQFSYCVTLFEAVYGVRPFEGRTFAELAANVEAGKIRSVSGGCVIRSSIHAALLRGLAVDPARRFANMTELLAALDDGRRRTLRRVSFVALPLGVALAAWAIVSPSPSRAIAFCRDGEELDVAWSGEQRQAVHSALVGTAVPYAAATADAVSERLDGWVDRWSAQRREICARPDAVVGEPTVDTVRRVQCLRRGRAAFAASIDVLATADTAAVRRALATTESLDAPELCPDADLGERPEPAPQYADAVAIVRERLARVETLLWAAKFDEAEQELATAREEADAIGFAPLAAEVTLFEGRAMLRRGDIEAGTHKVDAAAWAAMEAGDRSGAVRAFSALVYAHGVQRVAIEPARVAARAAWSELNALGGDTWLEGNLWLNEGAAELTANNFERARTAFQEALATGAFESRPMSHADLLINLASVSAELHEFDEAIATIQRARALYEAEAGPHHPAVASVLYNLGGTYYRKADYALAVEYIERASAIELETLGPRHPTHGNTLGSLGVALVAAGRYEEAVPPLREAVAILEANGDPLDATLSLQRVNLASALFELGRLDEAERSATRGHDDLITRLGPDHVEVATALSLLAAIARARGDLATAEAHARETVAIRTALYPATHSDLLYAQVDLAEVLAERGRRDEALELLDHIRALHPSPTVALEAHAYARFLAARERLVGDDEAKARSELAAAVTELRTLGDTTHLGDVEAWLHAHPDAMGDR